MTSSKAGQNLSSEVAKHLPFLRRYARALTGSQDSGDRYAIATLEAVVAEPETVLDTSTIKIGLFRAFHTIWTSSGTPVADDEVDGGVRGERAQYLLRGLSADTREVLLLKTIEGFTLAQVGEIMGSNADDAERLFEIAQAEMSDQVTGDVMIIEDESIIAMDLQSIVSSMGHNVTGIARTRDSAVELGKKKVPDLILADIQLADKSSGIDAVKDLLDELGERPVIFITAFPERLLSGEKPEPPFLITKPFTEEQVRAAVSQAMFFASTEGMEVGA